MSTLLISHKTELNLEFTQKLLNFLFLTFTSASFLKIFDGLVNFNL